jgi:LacI family transcriptional regulator
MMQKRITSKDIANLLGISRGTVDRALNNRGRISEETKKKVLDMSQEIGYKPNRIARTLVLQRDVRLAALLPTIPEYFFSKIEDGIRDAERELKDFGISVTYYHTKAVNDAMAQISQFEKIIEKKYDGILIVPANPLLLQPHVDAAILAGIPVVTLNNDVPMSKRLCFVGEDSIRAGRVAAELMAKFTSSKGKVAILSGFSQASSLHERYDGFQEVMAEQYPDVEVIGPYEYFENVTEAYEITKRLAHDYPDLTGIFLTTTTGLESAANAITDVGKQNRVKIIGFDINAHIEKMMKSNVIHATIYQDPYGQGYYSLRILSKYVMDGMEPDTEFLYTRLGVLLKEKLDDDGYPLYKY